MHGIVLIGVVTALAVLAIGATICVRKPKKAEKWEKGEILKQLLALSELESGSSAIATSSARSLPSASTSATGDDRSRTDTSRGRNAKQRYLAASSQRASLSRLNQPRPNQADGQVEEKIRQRAYELYQERGGVGGSPTDDWLQAKQEVLSRKARAGKGSS